MFNGDPSRLGNNWWERSINSTSVANLTQVWVTNVVEGGAAGDAVDSAPVYLPGVSTRVGERDMLFVNSRYGFLTGLDAATGEIIWQNYVPPNHPDVLTKSTPAIDPNFQFLYSYRVDGYVHKYNVSDGIEIKANGWPVPTTLNPILESGGTAINIFDGYLYMGMSGDDHDRGTYDGHVVAVNLKTGAATVWNALCSDRHYLLTDNTSAWNYCPIADENGAGIWARAGVVMDPLNRTPLVATGNGQFTGNQGGHYFADSVVRLRSGLPNATGLMLDSYTPVDFLQMQEDDFDLGSTAPVILPAQKGSLTPHMLLQASKDGYVRLLNRENLSGQGCCGHVGGEVFNISFVPGGFVLTAPLAWLDEDTDITWVWVSNGYEQNGFVAYTVVTDAAGHSSLKTMYSLPITANSPLMANNVLFVQTPQAVLALKPTTGQTLWTSSNTGPIHMQSPIVMNGRLYTSDDNGNVYGFAL